MLLELIGRKHPDEQPNPSRDQDRVVEQSEHRDEVRDEIDRRQSIGRDEQPERLGIAGRPRVARGQPGGMGVDA